MVFSGILFLTSSIIPQKCFSSVEFVKIPITSISNSMISDNRLDTDRTKFNFSDNVLLGASHIPFSIPSDVGNINNYYNTSVNYPNSQSAYVNTSIRYSTDVYVLLAAGGTNIPSGPKKFGQINLVFSNNSTISTNLVEGSNIREWILDDASNYRTTTDPAVENVWIGIETRDKWKSTIIDMLRIPIDQAYKDLNLTKIELVDTTPDRSGLHFMGISVRTDAPSSPTPIVFIPGFGGSWNREALIENKTVAQSEWSLTPFATEEYKAFIQTLKNAGLVEGTTLFSFYYDWRRPVTDNGSVLKTFLDAIPGKVNIVGHSMGGLVARACVDKVAGCKDKVNKIVTAGSPHTGAVDAYYLWNGLIPEKDELRKTIEELLLKANNRGYTHPKDIVRNVVPSVRDILPVFDYINWHAYSVMNSSNKNPFLETAMTNSSLVTTISGNKTSGTPEKLSVYPPTSIENALGLWLDGRPFAKTYGTGDETVLNTSSKIAAAANYNFETYHGGLVATENSQKKILEILGLPTTNTVSTFTPGNAWQSLWFILHSPATLKVYQSEVEVGTSLDSKTVYIKNPGNGPYTVKITGTGAGIYNLDIGAMGQGKVTWQLVSGTASIGSEHQYALNFTNSDNIAKVTDLDGFGNLNMAKTKLVNMGGFWPNYFISVINGIQSNSGARVKIEKLLGQIMTQIKASGVASVRSDYTNVAEYLINAYEIMAPKYGYVLSSTVVSKDLTRTQTLINSKTSYYLIVKPTTLAALNYTLANNYLARGQEAYNLGQYYRAYLLSRLAFQLF